MEKSNRKVVFILALVSLGLSLLMFIPMGKTYNTAENLIKFVILPIVIFCLNLVITYYKFREYRPVNRFEGMIGYVPMLSYMISSFVYLSFLINRADVFAVYNYTNFVFLQILFGLVIAMLTIVLNLMDRVNLRLSKNQVNVVDVLFYVAFVLDVLVIKNFVTNKYLGLELVNSTFWHCFICILIGMVLLGILAYRVYSLYMSNEEFVAIDKEETIEKWMQEREDAYYNSELVILYSMYNYTRERVAIQDEKKTTELKLDESNVVVNVDELNTLKNQLKELKIQQKENAAKHNKMKESYVALQSKVKLEVSIAELEAAKKELAAVSASVDKLANNLAEDTEQYNSEKAAFDERFAQLEAERSALITELGLDKPAEESKTEAPKPVTKVEKLFVPSYQEMYDYALSLGRDDLSVVPNATGTQHKFLVGKKPYLIMQKTSNDYRVTFVADEQSLFEYLRGYPALISVATSPKGGNWLKLANTGELDPEFLKGIIKGSLEAELAYEAAAIAQKEAEKQAKLEAKELEKENREKLREAERIIAKARREEEKALLKAQKDAEKAVIKAQKEAEKAQEEYDKVLAKNTGEETEVSEEQKAAEEKLQNAKEAALKTKEAYEKLLGENNKEAEVA